MFKIKIIPVFGINNSNLLNPTGQVLAPLALQQPDLCPR